MSRYCHRVAQVIFAQLVVTMVFITVSLAWPAFGELRWGVASPAYLFAMFLAATAGFQWAHGHRCPGVGSHR